MAQIDFTMSATGGMAAERCTCHDRLFLRGETMYGITYDNGDPAGWFCAEGVAQWEATGKPPELPIEKGQ